MTDPGRQLLQKHRFVDVEHQEDSRLHRIEGREERQSVLSIDDDVEAVPEIPEIFDRDRAVHGHPVADSRDPDTVDHIRSRAAREARGQPFDAVSLGDPPFSHLMQVRLRAAGARFWDPAS